MIVTHEQDIARRADRIIVLHDGRVTADTTDFDQALQALHSVDNELPAQESEPLQEESIDGEGSSAEFS